MSNVKVPILVSAWTNGGGFYGLKVLGEGRNAFESDWGTVVLDLPGLTKPVVATLSASFWKSCPEIRSTGIREFLDHHGILSWPPRCPPRFLLIPAGRARFALEFIKEP